MLFANGGRAVFRRTALVQGLAGVAGLVAAGAVIAAAVQVAPPWTSPAKYDLTQFNGGGVMESDPALEIEVKATGISDPKLVQDTRPVGTTLTRRGLGISGGNPAEIDGNEVLQVKTIPDGSAQGVTGVWLSNLYCGNDGGNTGGCLTTTPNNQATGEQGTVEIDYLDPAGPQGISCKSFKALGTANLNSGPLVQGDVYVDFGVTLQMVAARFSTREPSVLGLCGLGGSSGVGNNEFSVLGFVLDESEQVVTCAGDETCDAVNIPGFRATIENSPAGTFILANSGFIVDTRDHCKKDYSNGPGADTAVLEVTLKSATYDDVTFTIPANLCGIPNNAGISQIWINSVVSELDEGQSFFDQIVNLDVAKNPANPAYSCLDPSVASPDASTPINPDVYKQPVQAWIPRDDMDGGYLRELPVLDASGNRSYVVQDVTTYCDGYGGVTRRLSNLVSNLHYVPTSAYPNFRAVIAAELDRLQQTVNETFVCINNGKAQSTLSSDFNNVRKWFDRADYPRAVAALNTMATDIKGSRLAGPLQACTADLNTGALLPPTPANPPAVVPALAYSYLLVQIEHLKYHINDKLLGIRVNPPDGYAAAE